MFAGSTPASHIVSNRKEKAMKTTLVSLSAKPTPFIKQGCIVELTAKEAAVVLALVGSSTGGSDNSLCDMYRSLTKAYNIDSCSGSNICCKIIRTGASLNPGIDWSLIVQD